MPNDRYIYPAIFDYADDGISIEFPDLPGCLPSAHTTEDAFKNAKEAMGLHLYCMEKDKDEMPDPTPIDKIKTESNQAVVLVEVWMPLIRDAIENRSVKKTLTIPKWLNDLAEDKHVNFSHILQEALKARLGVNTSKQ